MILLLSMMFANLFCLFSPCTSLFRYFVKFTIQSFPCLICSITNRGSLNVNSAIINDFHHHFSVFACYQVQI